MLSAAEMVRLASKSVTPPFRLSSLKAMYKVQPLSLRAVATLMANQKTYFVCEVRDVSLLTTAASYDQFVSAWPAAAASQATLQQLGAMLESVGASMIYVSQDYRRVGISAPLGALGGITAYSLPALNALLTGSPDVSDRLAVEERQNASAPQGTQSVPQQVQQQRQQQQLQQSGGPGSSSAWTNLVDGLVAGAGAVIALGSEEAQNLWGPYFGLSGNPASLPEVEGWIPAAEAGAAGLTGAEIVGGALTIGGGVVLAGLAIGLIGYAVYQFATPAGTQAPPVDTGTADGGVFSPSETQYSGSEGAAVCGYVSNTAPIDTATLPASPSASTDPGDASAGNFSSSSPSGTSAPTTPSPVSTPAPGSTPPPVSTSPPPTIPPPPLTPPPGSGL